MELGWTIVTMELRYKTILQRRPDNEPYLTSLSVRIARFLTLAQMPETIDPRPETCWR